MRHRLRSFGRLPAYLRWLFVEAFVCLGLARLAMAWVPFRALAARLGAQDAQTPADVQPDEAQRARRIGWAVELAARHTPWESACLAQALAGKLMLRRRRIASTMYIGVAKDDARKLVAHAWLRVGNAVVTGAAGRERYAVLSTFGDTFS